MPTNDAASNPAVRTACGWCNRVLSHGDGPTRHVTCDDCRGFSTEITQPIAARPLG